MLRGVVAFVLITHIFILNGYARTSVAEAERKAEEMHRHASSDIIYTDDELKALYYQNVQIIQLLKEIKEVLKESLAETKKASQ